MNVQTLVADFEDAALVARALALLADQLDIGQKLHLDGDRAIALAVFAAAAGDVEGEMARRVAALVRLRRCGEQRRGSDRRLECR